MNSNTTKSEFGKLVAVIIPIGMAISFLMFTFVISRPVFAQEENSGTSKIGVGGFIDEDGDGFNDLLPDSDGDGVPDAIDPDSKNQHSDSLFIHMNGKADSTGMGHHPMGDSLRPGMPGDRDPFGHGMFPGMPGPFPGEPGQYGPGDSTGHGGMHDHHGDHHGDGFPPVPPPPPDSGGMGGHIIGPGTNQSHDIGSTPNINNTMSERSKEMPEKQGGK